jgi:hypothetical protein
MTPVTTRPRPAPSPVAVGPVVAMAVAAALCLVTAAHLTADRPSFVSEVTVVNPTVYEVSVELGGDHGGHLDPGTIRREHTATFEEVIDQGPRWVVRFSYGGVPAGEVSLSRAQLAAAGWRITVPPEVGERLRLAGLRPSAR